MMNPTSTPHPASPDELYTLRAQYWLGHYNLAIEEAKTLSRKIKHPEKDEFLARAQVALGQRMDQATTPALQAIQRKAELEQLLHSGQTPPDTFWTQLATLAQQESGTHLYVAQAYMAAGRSKDAWKYLAHPVTLEQHLLQLQWYLSMQRTDLAQAVLLQMTQLEEDSILTQLASVYVGLATGQASSVLTTLHVLTEPYGASPYLLQLTAVALMQQGEYSAAQTKLQEALMEDRNSDDCAVNLAVCAVHLGQPLPVALPPQHSVTQGLERMQHAIEREAVKYQVS